MSLPHGSDVSRSSRLRVAVIGPGRAGSARARALETHPRAELAALVARPPAEPRFEAVLADPGIAALVVCTPNTLHAPQVGAGLDAGKHVAVEFPMASQAREARGLFEKARAHGRVLHVEHIELLSPSQQVLRATARGLGPPVGGRLLFQGDTSGWIGDDALAGGPGLRALARLHRLVDLFGHARVASVRMQRGATGAYRVEVSLQFERGGSMDLVEERAPGMARALEWDVSCEGGHLGTPAAERSTGLFARDLDLFLSRIETGGPPVVSEALELHVHELVDAIDASWVSCAPC